MGAEVDTEWCRGLSAERQEKDRRGVHLQAGARKQTHYHVAIISEAKESEALGAKSWRFRAVVGGVCGGVQGRHSNCSSRMRCAGPVNCTPSCLLLHITKEIDCWRTQGTLRAYGKQCNVEEMVKASYSTRMTSVYKGQMSTGARKVEPDKP